MLDSLKIFLAEFHEKLADVKSSLPRESEMPKLEKKIKVVIGMRRAGKSTFVLQKVQSLSEAGVPLERILYLNLEDDRLLPCSQEKLRALIDAFYQLYPDNHDHTCYLFLDEIQNASEWPILIRRLFDTKKIQIYLTGSSAKLLSKEIHTSLRGRAFSIEIWPYSITEFLKAYDVSFEEKLLGQKSKDQLRYYLEKYLKEGGFPETINTTDPERRDILQGYVDVVIMRDIIERHNISNIALIKYMIKTLIKNAGCGFSINKFSKDLQSQGISGAKNTLHDYLSFIEDTYLAFAVPLYSESIRKSQTNPKKIYAIDPGLVRSYSFSLSNNFGHLFENFIYLNLRRQGCAVYYYLTKERYEVDFFAIDKLGKPALYQVVWDVTDKKTMEREMRALKAAENELKIKGYLITPESYITELWEQYP